MVPLSILAIPFAAFLVAWLCHLVWRAWRMWRAAMQ